MGQIQQVLTRLRGLYWDGVSDRLQPAVSFLGWLRRGRSLLKTTKRRGLDLGGLRSEVPEIQDLQENRK